MNGSKFGTIMDEQLIPMVPTEILKGMGKYFSIALTLEPDNDMVSSKLASVKTNTMLSKPVLLQNLIMAPTIGIGVWANLPQDAVNYITQTEPGGKVSLMSLASWVSIWSRTLMRFPSVRASGVIGVSKIPRYILRPSIATRLVETRKKLGFYSETGRVNEDRLFVSHTGRLHYMPRADEFDPSNAAAFEEILDKALELSYSVGSPLNTNQVGETHKSYRLVDPAYSNIAVMKEDLSKYAGSIQAFNWDYNVAVCLSMSEPDKMVQVPLTGSIKPDSLCLAEYLVKPFAEGMSILFNQCYSSNKKLVTSNDFLSFDALADTSLFANIQQFYLTMLQRGKLPDFAELVALAAKDLGYPNLRDTSIPNIAQLELDLYVDLLDDNFKPIRAYSPTEPGSPEEVASRSVNGVMRCLKIVLQCVSGKPGTRLHRYWVKESNGEDLEDDPRYFNMETSQIRDFHRVYSLLGGRIFYRLLIAIQGLSVPDLTKIDLGSPAKQSSFNALSREVMPLAFILGKYCPNHEAILAHAEELRTSSINKDTSITENDIKLAGSLPTFQMFPHQLGAHQYLRNPIPPRFAILDIAAGGGKTTLVLSDVVALITAGHVKRPLILAPNGLVKNWAEDIQKVAGSNWNVIVVTTSTYRSWSDDALTDMITKAPINTIVVAGFTLLSKIDLYSLVIGNHVATVSGALEFLKKFEFDYIAIDESHKVKNPGSMIHNAVKNLTVASCVKYVRLATGTLISDKITDIVGQASLLGSHIFLTPAEFEDANMSKLPGTKVSVWNQDAPEKARKQLSRYGAVITYKRKEWAFMLPQPKETFIPVSMDKVASEGGDALTRMYNAIITDTIESIKRDSKLVDLLAGKSEDDDSTSTEGGSSAPSAAFDFDDATMLELEDRLYPYLARVEQLLTDPIGDDFGSIYFQNYQDFVPNKVLKAIERIRLNFTDNPWERGKKYHLKDTVDYEEVQYVLMGRPGEKLTAASYQEEYESLLPPDRDPRWKVEPYGKVIVFCRYIRTVNAVYNALPPDLKKIAVKFHGQVGLGDGEDESKWENLDAFKSTPYSRTTGAQILIANEQGMSEGHNLQMASRMIRLEAPWAPGELDQSAARIFRPDPTGKNSRENVYLDWILTTGSLEVPKMGRLISKMVIKTRFDEFGNPLYADLDREEYVLPAISMGLETLQMYPNLKDIKPYTDAYQVMASIQALEFAEMRQTRRASMVPIEPTPQLPNASKIKYLPYLPNQNIVDEHNFGLVKFNDFMESGTARANAAKENKRNLIGRYVHTERGNGIIVGVSMTGRAGRDPDIIRKVTNLKVQLANGDTYEADPAIVYLATKLTAETAKAFTPAKSWATPQSKVKSSRRDEAVKVQTSVTDSIAPPVREPKVIIKDRNSNRASELVNTPASISPVEMYSVVYNGYLAIEAMPEDEKDTTLKQHGYHYFGEYALVEIPTAVCFDSVLDYIEKYAVLSVDTIKRVNDLVNSFKTRGKKAFDSTLVPMSTLRNFYILRHRMSTIDKESGLPIIKVYPVIMHDKLLLNIDLETNPIAAKFINKAIRGTTTKFRKSDGFYVKFFGSKNELVSHVNQIRREGVEISNYRDFVAEVKSQNFKSQTKKQG
jgi:hypothetical protein